MRQSAYLEAARGFVLLAVCYVHLLYSFVFDMPDPAQAPIGFIQIKMLAPHVALFFLLSGMGSSGLAKRNPSVVIARSLSLILLAIATHVIGFLAFTMFIGDFETAEDAQRMLVHPIILGRGFVTQVAWFFIVLAVCRVAAFLWNYNHIVFLLIVATTTGTIWSGTWFGAPDNIWEWRNWPVAIILFLIGMRIPSTLKVSTIVAVPCLVLGTALTLFNRPFFVTPGQFLQLDWSFVAQPMVGEYGNLLIFLVQTLCIFFALLWLSQSAVDRSVARLPKFVGRNSMSFLVVHGMLIATVFHRLYTILPEQESWWIYPALLLGSTLANVMAFIAFRRPSDRLIFVCGKMSRTSINGILAFSMKIKRSCIRLGIAPGPHMPRDGA